MARIPPSGWFPRRGEVYLVRLDKHRPALVISGDARNRTAAVVHVVPMTTVRSMESSLRVQVKPGEGGLNRDSWVKCDEATKLEKDRLVYPPLGRLGDAKLKIIEQRIKLAMSWNSGSRG